jgi:hypothetical protein
MSPAPHDNVVNLVFTYRKHSFVADGQ